MDLEILYEDEDCVVINKPAGLVVHADGKTKEQSVSDWVLEKYPDMREVGEPWEKDGEKIYRPGIVHRLDRDTSGALLIAKNQEAFSRFKSQFQSRDIAKIYLAFVYGEMKTEDGVIDRQIGRSRSDFRQWSAQRGARGEMRDAVTEYKVLAKKDGVSFIEVKPKTGRTHQIRVHFKAINHPIVADPLYAPKMEPVLGFKRLALHAKSIAFTDHTGKEITVEAPLPADFAHAVAKITAS